MLIIALAIVFFILAALFKSILDPLVIMFAIPFAIVGVIIGHMIFGYNLQFLSMIGFLALTGIVVNDSLILIDFAKKRRADVQVVLMHLWMLAVCVFAQFYSPQSQHSLAFHL